MAVEMQELLQNQLLAELSGRVIDPKSPPSTRMSYRSDLKMVSRVLVDHGLTHVDHLGVGDLITVGKVIEGSDESERTKNHRVSMLRRIARKYGIPFDEVAAAGIQTQFAEPDSVRIALPQKGIDDLLLAMSGHLRQTAYVLLALDTGRNVSQLLGLNCIDVEQDEEGVEVDFRRKYREDRRKKIPLSERAGDSVVALQRQVSAKYDGGALFRNWLGGRLSRNTVNMELHKAGQEIEVTQYGIRILSPRVLQVTADALTMDR